MSYEQTINNLDSRIDISYKNVINNKQLSLEFIDKKIRKELVLNKIDSIFEEVVYLGDKANDLINHSLVINEQHLQGLIDKAIILNPLNLMSKGYAITYQNNQVVSSVDKIDEKLPLEVRMKDGLVIANVNQKIKNN